MDEFALRAQGLWYAFERGSYVLRGADLFVRRASVTMILGRSGSGKTTLLKLLAGLLKPQEGTIDCRVRTAYIPQTLGLVRSVSALDNVLSGALSQTGTLRSVFKCFPSKTVQQARATLTSLGLAGKCLKPVYQLSGGERQRVAIARALMQKSEVILADEFVSQLDPVTADDILHMTRHLASRGVSFLITTHELDTVKPYADEFMIMSDGRVACQGEGKSFDESQAKETLKNVSTNN